MAKKFTFRLEPVLKLRSHKVSIAKDSLNQAVRIRLEKDYQIDEKRSYRQELMSKPVQSVTASMMQANYHHRLSVDYDILKLEEEKLKLLDIEKSRRVRLTSAMKDEKVLEKLKEKKKEMHDFEAAKEDSLFMDELAINRYGKAEISE